MIDKIATAAVYVDDQDKALDFWTKKVGFIVHREQAMGPLARWIELGPNGAATCLVIYPKAMMEDWQLRRPSIIFSCSNVQFTYEQLHKRGVKFSQKPKKMAWGPFAMFLDTEDNWYGLREH